MLLISLLQATADTIPLLSCCVTFAVGFLYWS